MKTPRDILFQRHQSAKPKLDAIRQSAVAAIGDRRLSTGRDRERQSATAAAMIWQTLWRELIFPSRRIWTGLAAVWILIIAVNFSQRDPAPARAGKSSPTPGMVMALKDQQRILAELLGDRTAPPEADRQKVFLPKPRTENGGVLTT